MGLCYGVVQYVCVVLSGCVCVLEICTTATCATSPCVLCLSVIHCISEV